MDLSVVLVNWNALELTSRALASIKETTRGIEYEVFVVDNGTTKDASAIELPRRFTWVKFILNQHNLGFSGANNQAIRRSVGRYVLLLNNDTVQIENALGKAIEYMDAHTEVGALGITHLNDDRERTFQSSAYDFPSPWDDIAALLGKRFADDAPASAGNERDVDWVVGSFLLVRRSCWQDVGDLDERFFVYDEDIDWCLRARRAGWKVRYWPGARMIHLGSASKPHLKDKTFMHFRSHLTYIRKNHSLPAAGAYYVAMAARLTAATGWQALRVAAGRATPDALRERWDRQRQFLLLRSTRRGVQ